MLILKDLRFLRFGMTNTDFAAGVSAFAGTTGLLSASDIDNLENPADATKYSKLKLQAICNYCMMRSATGANMLIEIQDIVNFAKKMA
jgi:hypothetical protein